MKWKKYSPTFNFLPDCLDHVWFGHIFFAYDLMRNINPDVFVELGTYYGTSMSSFAQAVKDGSLKTRIFAVDCWEGDTNAGMYGEYVYTHVNALVKKYFSEVHISLVKKYFNEAVHDFEDNSIGILHIDGLHTYEAVKQDYQTWLPKMQNNGIILFHDIFVQEYGVKDLWKELIISDKFSYLEFPQSFGLGVLFLDKKLFNDIFDGVDLSKLVSDYVNTAVEAITVQDVIQAEIFGNIARAEMGKEINMLAEQRSKLENELAMLSSELFELKQEFSELRQQNQELQSKIINLQNKKAFRILNRLMTTIGRPLMR
ncbi:MAG: class I SAM-dependent methyltransferase [Candidatus Dojkabacteria bacterium]